MPEPFPPQTWPEGATPTVDQLKVWIQTFEDHHDARIAADMIAGELGRVQVDLERYQSAIRGANAAYDRLRAQRDRYRLAWRSARARACGFHNAAVRLAREVAPLDGLRPEVCTDPDCPLPRRPRPGFPMHGPHDFRAKG